MLADWFLICCQISRIHNLIIGSSLNSFQIISIEKFLLLPKIFAPAFIWKIILTLLLLVVCSTAYFWCHCCWGRMVARGLSWEVWSSLCFHVWSQLARPLESTSWLSLPIACRNKTQTQDADNCFPHLWADTKIAVHTLNLLLGSDKVSGE